MIRLALLSVTLVGCSAFRMSVPVTDAVPLRAPLARAIAAKTDVRPTAVTPLADAEVDDARIFPDVVVASTTKLEPLVQTSIARAPRCAHLLGVDRSSGAIRWSHDRPSDCGDRLLAATSDSVWYLDGHGKAVRVHASDGSIQGEIDAPQGSAVAYDDSTLVVASGAEVRRHDLATGGRLWSWQAGAAKVQWILLQDGVVMLETGTDLVVLDAASGAPTGRAAIGGTLVKSAALRPRWSSGALSLVTKSGDVVVARGQSDATRTPVGAALRATASTATGFALLTKNDVRGIDPATAAASFTTPLPAEANASLLYVPETPSPPSPAPATGPKARAKAPPATPTKTPRGLLVTTTTDAVVGIDAADGAVRFTATLPDTFPRKRGRDELFVTADGGTIVVESDFHFVGISSAKGTTSWALDASSYLYARPGPAANVAARLLSALDLGNAPSLADSKKSVEEATRSVEKGMRDAVDAMGTAGMNIAGESLVVSTNLLMAAVLQERLAYGHLFKVAEALRAQARADAAAIAEARGRSGDWLARPIHWSAGEGVLVVHLTDGAFVEVPTGPSERWYESFRLWSAPRLSPDASVLVAVWAGLDPSAWREDAGYEAVHMLGNSMLTFTLSPTAFHPAAEYATRSIVPPFDKR